jgi:hypothetical protein
MLDVSRRRITEQMNGKIPDANGLHFEPIA